MEDESGVERGDHPSGIGDPATHIGLVQVVLELLVESPDLDEEPAAERTVGADGVDELLAPGEREQLGGIGARLHIGPEVAEAVSA